MGATGSEGIALGDAELISAAREGDAAAFGLLYERHAGATWAVARQYTNSAADAEDVVAEAFTKVFAILKGGGGPDVAFRAYIFTTARRLGLQRVQAGNRTQPTDDVQVLEAALEPESSTEAPALADFERGVVGRAYSTLPERWQAVLWYTEVESLSPAKIGPLLGLSANGVAALAYRAREGLRQAYLQQHLQDPLDSGCRTIAGKLGAYVRGGLATRETAHVDQHLEGCGECRALLLELGDVNHGMRVVIRWVTSDDCQTPEDAALALEGVDAVLVPGGFGVRGIEGKLGALRWAREQQVPTLGICLGLQCMVIEYARNVLGLPGASSSEFDTNPADPVVATMAEQLAIVDGAGDLGGTMRLGAYPAVLKPGSVVAQAYGTTEVSERHRHRYEVNNAYRDKLEGAGLVVSGASPDDSLVEFVELPREVHPYYVSTQAHPEFKSRPNRAHPLFAGLIGAALERRGTDED